MFPCVLILVWLDHLIHQKKPKKRVFDFSCCFCKGIKNCEVSYLPKSQKEKKVVLVRLFSKVCLICVVWLDHLICQKSQSFPCNSFFSRSLCLICCVWWDQGPHCMFFSCPKIKGIFKFSRSFICDG